MYTENIPELVADNALVDTENIPELVADNALVDTENIPSWLLITPSLILRIYRAGC